MTDINPQILINSANLRHDKDNKLIPRHIIVKVFTIKDRKTQTQPQRGEKDTLPSKIQED